MTTNDDRRRNFRADLRTVVNVYTPESLSTTPPTFLRAWSEDISATGARLISESEIEPEKVWLKFLAQGKDDCVIEAEIVRRGMVPRSHFRPKDKLHDYGVRFLRLLNESEFLELSLDQVERVTTSRDPAAASKKVPVS
ncbi:MAG: PilZ domain-containing protein [Planctomycetaceae bacterium]